MNSREYWRKREEKHIKEMMAKSIDYEREIARIYNQQLRSIETQIEAFYQRYATKNKIDLATVKLQAKKTDVEALADTARILVDNKDFSEYANEILALYNMKMKVSRLELLQDEIKLELIKNGVYTEKYMGQTLTDEAKAEYKRQAGILGDTVKTLDTSNVKSIINGSFHNASFSERIWSNTNALSNHLDTFLTQSIINGKHPNDVARDVRKMFGVSRAEAERLMRTESARVQADVTLDSYKQYGFEKYEWIAEPSACSLCKPLDGKTFDVDKAEYGKSMFPMHPNCRCAVTVAVDEVKYREWLAEKARHESGALNDENDPDLSKRTTHAKKYYNAVRGRDKKAEITAISHNTNFSYNSIEQVYEHIFINKYDLAEGYSRFYPSYDMAQSWQRLREGKNIQKHDLLLLEHEMYEQILMNVEKLSYDKAHKQTNLLYNYSKENDKFKERR